ncbi:class I SAM-dependent methyltransferase [Pseudoduganella umbonata]|uniref:Methyltransferase domain-containing protein n=1 Tax=Pseudoduganella umbonata TaxID=864828 RepID=A0A4P8HLE3_9BURK|nr:class I SAM-dependent methyltransferase [Pseudoduganella umbonata]MBB3221651.1 SAM-dependent methyltransferase [Pseudoduganella umbonata]QCP09122.1 methyltransferase domain-containing protein [Pseudoduganella umbonata]
MDWTAGYTSDIEYTAGFYREQSPTWLNLVCILNGCEPVALDQPFTYFDLGCGRGLTAQILAAGNPNGRFFAADFNPSHVASANRLTGLAQLENLTLLENSFEELANGCVDLPPLDFITMHGVYTWVNEENRRHIVSFVNRYLKPGGVVYVSYNAMPGWAAALPLQRLVVEYAGLFPNRSDQTIKGASELVDALVHAQAAYLTQNPALSIRTHTLRTANPNYLVHEYMHRDWKPLFHADVARNFASAKMTFIGSADLPFAYPSLFLNEEMAALLEQINTPEVRETLKDYFWNTSFRKDVFVRGQNRIGLVRQGELLEQVGLVLMVPRTAATAEIKLTVGDFSPETVLYDAVLDAIAVRPHTLGELAKIPALNVLSMQELAQIAVLLCASNQVELYNSANVISGCEKAKLLNNVLAAQVRYGDEHAAFCSPLLGSGVAADSIERLFYLALSQGVAEDEPVTLARHVWQTMAPIRRRMFREGSAQRSEIDNLPELKLLAEKFAAEKIPVWRLLNIL